MIYGNRLRFRWAEDDDTEFLINLRNVKGMNDYFYTSEPFSYWGHAKFMNNLKNGDDKFFVVEEIETEQAIGAVSVTHIDWMNRTAEYGRLIIDPITRGKGYGKEIELMTIKYVFDTLNMNKFWCEVLEYNQRVVKLHQETGFIIDGIMRQHIYKDGIYHNVVLMSLLKEDYLKNKEG